MNKIDHILVKCPHCLSMLDSYVYKNGLVVVCCFCKRTFRLWKSGFSLIDWAFTTQLYNPPMLPPASSVLRDAKPELPPTPKCHVPTDAERLRWIDEELSAGAYGDIAAREDYEGGMEANGLRDDMDRYKRECKEWSKRWELWTQDVAEWNHNHPNDQITIPPKPIPAARPDYE